MTRPHIDFCVTVSQNHGISDRHPIAAKRGLGQSKPDDDDDDDDEMAPRSVRKMTKAKALAVLAAGAALVMQGGLCETTAGGNETEAVVPEKKCETCEYVAAPLEQYEGISDPAVELLDFVAALPGGFAVIQENLGNALDFASVLQVDGAPASYWHDIPTYANATSMMDASETDLLVNFVPEIRRGAIGKLEIIKELENNPVKYDRKTVTDSAGNALYERPRYVAYGPNPFTYGAIPQTWENSEEPDPVTGIVGDNDPIDALDISAGAVPDIGYPYVGKVLGALGLIDDNETDWKVVMINAADPKAAEYNDIGDVPEDTKEAIFTYFRCV